MDYSKMTREEAIEALVELDVAKWGAEERDASRRLHRDRSRGRALNALAHRPEYDYGANAPAGLKAAAKAALTDSDHAELRKGG